MSKHTAPGQFYGYSAQITRALAHLLVARPGQAVSVEYLDDVATTSPQQNQLEQVKSGLAQNPVADRSVQLWKTLSSWVEAIRNGALATETAFVLHVLQDHTGDVVQRLNDCKDFVGATNLVQQLRDEFWGPAPDRPLKTGLPTELAIHVNQVLGASEEIVARLIMGFRFERGSGTPKDDLLPAVRNKAISEGALEDVLQQLLGWVKVQVDKAIESRRPPIIEWDEFNKRLVAVAKKLDRQTNVLISPGLDIASETVERELQDRVYVKQLRLVNTEDARVIRAVNDFLRASADRTSWSEQGDVLEDGFKEFESSLCRTWENQKARLEIELVGRSEEDAGQVLLSRCLDHVVRLDGKEVPGHFVPGSYHSLADSLDVGWHARFRSLIGGLPKQDTGSAQAGKA